MAVQCIERRVAKGSHSSTKIYSLALPRFFPFAQLGRLLHRETLRQNFSFQMTRNSTHHLLIQLSVDSAQLSTIELIRSFGVLSQIGPKMLLLSTYEGIRGPQTRFFGLGGFPFPLRCFIDRRFSCKNEKSKGGSERSIPIPYPHTSLYSYTHTHTTRNHPEMEGGRRSTSTDNAKEEAFFLVRLSWYVDQSGFPIGQRTSERELLHSSSNRSEKGGTYAYISCTIFHSINNSLSRHFTSRRVTS